MGSGRESEPAPRRDARLPGIYGGGRLGESTAGPTADPTRERRSSDPVRDNGGLARWASRNRLLAAVHPRPIRAVRDRSRVGITSDRPAEDLALVPHLTEAAQRRQGPPGEVGASS